MERTIAVTVCATDGTSGGVLEKLLRRKQGYLLAAFFDQVADPMEHACFRLRLRRCIRREKFIVKRKVSRGRRHFQGRMILH